LKEKVYEGALIDKGSIAAEPFPVGPQQMQLTRRPWSQGSKWNL